MSGSIQPGTKNLPVASNDGNSRFLSLPPEIRQLIYVHLFTNQTVVVSRYYTTKDAIPPLNINISILLTNKLCHHESKPVFFSETTFRLEPESRPTTKRAVFGPTCHEVRNKFGLNAQHVSHVYFRGSEPQTIFAIHDLFPNIALFELELGEDFFHSDQISFDRAMRYALRYGEWKSAIRTALDEGFPSGMRDAVARLRHLGPKRGFKVTLHWSMAYRFVQFKGVVDLDEWILRIWDPDAKSTKVYEVPQNPLEPTWCDGRLTLPAAPAG